MAKHLDIIEGYLGKVGELRQAGNSCVVNFSIAESQRLKKGEEWVDGPTIWTDCTIWGPLAKSFMQSNPAAGMPLLVIGERSAREMGAYTKDNGESIPARVVQQVNVLQIGVSIKPTVVISGWEKVNNYDNAKETNTSYTAPKASTQSTPSTPKPQATSQEVPRAPFASVEDDEADIFDMDGMFDDLD